MAVEASKPVRRLARLTMFDKSGEISSADPQHWQIKKDGAWFGSPVRQATKALRLGYVIHKTKVLKEV